MCGIGAIVGFEAPGSDPSALARELIARLAHRGPDASAVRTVARGVTLAHSRLSIIDLSAAGMQPIGNEDGTVWVVCNGEIYNHIRLRESLLARGHRFSSRSDSEVLVHLWEDCGREMLDRIDGMFAFVLVDSRSGDVLVARDRLGKKPVVYAATPAGLAIASEIPALRGIPGIDWSLDPQALALYLLRNLRHIPDPWTMYCGVRRLAPGHAMLVRNVAKNVSSNQPQRRCRRSTSLCCPKNMARILSRGRSNPQDARFRCSASPVWFCKSRSVTPSRSA